MENGELRIETGERKQNSEQWRENIELFRMENHWEWRTEHYWEWRTENCSQWRSQTVQNGEPRTEHEAKIESICSKKVWLGCNPYKEIKVLELKHYLLSPCKRKHYTLACLNPTTLRFDKCWAMLIIKTSFYLKLLVLMTNNFWS